MVDEGSIYILVGPTPVLLTSHTIYSPLTLPPLLTAHHSIISLMYGRVVAPHCIPNHHLSELQRRRTKEQSRLCRMFGGHQQPRLQCGE